MEQLIHREGDDRDWLEVWQDGRQLSLYYDDTVLQTQIDLDHPELLPNPGNRAMLAHLLFGQQPAQVLLAGCGGGGIARWFLARSPRTLGVAVEISERIARIARKYFDFPPPGKGWKLRVKDVRDYLPRTPGRFDFILVDLDEETRTPDWLGDTEFLRACHDALTPDGVLTVNVIAEEAEELVRVLRPIREIFDYRTLCLSLPEHHNVMVLAFRQPPELDGLEERLPELEDQWGLEFGEFLQRMRAENPPGSGIF